jgi:hypothetical protein
MLSSQAGEGQEVVDELTHHMRAASDYVKFMERIFVKFIGLFLEDHASIPVYGAERRTQVM